MAVVNLVVCSVKFEDELMGELICFVVVYEVGYILGLFYNMGLSVVYLVDFLCKVGFVQCMGVVLFIMDYVCFNYVVQFEDEGVGFFLMIGFYDIWFIIYGYKLILESDSVEDECVMFNEWIKEWVDDLVYCFGQ